MWQVHVASYKLLTFLYDKPSRVLSMPKRDPLILVTFSVCVCVNTHEHMCIRQLTGIGFPLLPCRFLGEKWDQS